MPDLPREHLLRSCMWKAIWKQSSQWTQLPEVPGNPVTACLRMWALSNPWLMAAVTALWSNTSPRQKAFFRAVWKTDMKAASKRSQKGLKVELWEGACCLVPNTWPFSSGCNTHSTFHAVHTSHVRQPALVLHDLKAALRQHKLGARQNMQKGKETTKTILLGPKAMMACWGKHSSHLSSTGQADLQQEKTPIGLGYTLHGSTTKQYLLNPFSRFLSTWMWFY